MPSSATAASRAPSAEEAMDRQVVAEEPDVVHVTPPFVEV